MYRPALTFGVFVLLIGFSVFFVFTKQNNPALPSTDPLTETNNFEENEAAYDEPLEALKLEFEKTRDPKLNIVPRERLVAAWQMLQQARYKNNAAITPVNWTERGPSNQGGRTRAILVDQNDATGKTVWCGSVGGGLWKTTDITAASPTWTAVNDLFGNLAITSIAQDPGTPQNMYFCTGEGYSNIDAIRGAGVWKSTDGGGSWSQLSATNNSSYYYCQKILCIGSGVVLVATRTGLYRSANGGISFSQVLASGIAGATSSIAYDVELAANGDLYASMSGTLHKSTFSGATWTTPLTLPVTSPGRMEIACAPSDANYVYVMLEKSSQVNAILKSTNAGASFSSLTKPTDADAGIPAADISRGQAWYDMSVAVDPNNRDIVYVGGVDLFRTSNGGSSWQQITHWYGGFGYQYMHADQHFAYYSPGSSSICYFSNDGAIYRTANASAATPTISRKDYNYNTAQFYGCAIHPTANSNYFLAGAQDNGSHSYGSTGINATTQVTGGDGAFVHIDINQPTNQLTSYVYNNIFYSTNGGTSFTSYASDNTGRFINPSDLDGINNILYSARNTNEVLRWTNIFTASPSKTTLTFTGMSSTQATHIKVSPNTATTIYVGTSNGKVLKITGANGASPAATNINTGLPAGYVSCIEVEKGNENHLLVCFTNYGVTSIYESVNGGTSWTSVEGNLPDMPVRWCIFNPSNNDQAVLATELGVWTTDNLNGGSTVWGSSNTGLANVRVDMLKVRASDSIVIAATHGRGLYSTDAFTTVKALFSCDKRVAYPGQSVQFTDASTRSTSWAWDFDNNGTTDAATKNPSYSFNTPGYYTVKLTINGGVSSYTYTNVVHVLPYLGTPYTPANGGNFDNAGTASHFDADVVSGTLNIWERGAPGNTLTTLSSAPNCWKTLLSANVTQGTYQCALYSPSFNFSAAGTYTLSFKGSMALAFCNAPFAVQMQYSTNHGSTWTRLGVNGSGTNWYTSYPTSVGCITSSTIFADQYSWNSAFNNATMSYNVSSLQGNTKVCFRLVLSVVSGYSAAAYAADGFMIDDFQISGPTNSAFPVEWLSFTASRKQNDVLLNWATASELNNKGFEVQRSDNASNWTRLGFVPGNGTTPTVHTYVYTDANAFSTERKTWYYRLRQIDFNGDAHFSDIREVNNSKAIQVSIFPNPFSYVLQVQTSDEQAVAYYSLNDLNGNPVMQDNVTDASFIIQTENIKAGLYLLALFNKDHDLIKVVKVFKY